MIYVVPILIIAALIYGLIKKVPLYDAFVDGAKKAFPLVVDIFPYILAVLVMCEVFEQSGLSSALIDLLTPFFKIFGIEKGLIKLILVKPFSGSGSLALLNEIITEYGVDSYVARCAAVVFGSSETIFYVGAVYFATTKKENFFSAVLISLVSTFISVVFGVFICKIL